MKRSNEKDKPTCDQIEMLLVSMTYDQLTEDENRLIEEHLAACERCRRYQNAISRLKSAVGIGEEEKPTPHPSIRENLVQRMKQLKSEEEGVWDRIWKSIGAAFAYRIPAYQAVAGIALIVAMSLTLRNLPSSVLQEPPEERPLVRMEMPELSEMSVIDNLDILRQQKIGINVTEDTTLTRFIVSGM
jgi:anti-sigma factor RsiW